VPDDIALAAVDDGDPGLAVFGVPVITAKQAAETIGRETAEALLARIAHPFKPVEIRRIRALRLPGDKENEDQEVVGA
jgi:DNA-binding LacI/PurR family transcriptional regulator